MPKREFKTIEFSDASELLEALTIYRKDWLGTKEWDTSWAFRGQYVSDLDLTPSALRQKTNTPQLRRIKELRELYIWQYGSHITKSMKRVNALSEKKIEDEYMIYAFAQGRAEYDLIFDFIKLADNIGHPIPGAEQLTFPTLSDIHINLPDISPGQITDYSEILKPRRFSPYPNPAVSLAQHYGIPTRCLDWTKNPFIAAFFAAEQADPNKKLKKIAIWAINISILTKHSRGLINRENCQFSSFSVPRSYNPYLHAQDGLFTFPIAGCEYYLQNGRWPTLEEFCCEIEQVESKEILKKYTLENDAAGELLRLLWAQRISRAYLMPVYENVTNSLINKWKWINYTKT